MDKSPPPLLRSQMTFKDATLGDATVVHNTRALLGERMVSQMTQYLQEHGEPTPTKTPQRSTKHRLSKTPTAKMFQSEDDALFAIRKSNASSQQSKSKQRNEHRFDFPPTSERKRATTSIDDVGPEHRCVGDLPKIAVRGPVRHKAGSDYLGEMFAAKHFPQPSNNEDHKVRYAEIVRRYHDPKLPVHQWSTKLLAEMEQVIPADAPKPHPLRSAVSMFILDKIFESYNLPRAVFDDIRAAVYVDGGQEALDIVHGKGSKFVLPAEDRYNYIERRHYFQAFERSKAKMQEVTERTAAMLRDATVVKEQLKTADQKARGLTLRMIFSAWKSVLRQTSWRKAAKMYFQQRDNFKLKSKTLHAWRDVVVTIHHTEHRKALEHQATNAELDAEKKVAAFQADLDMRMREMRQEMSVSLGGRQRTIDIEVQEKMEQDLAAMSSECGSLQRRVTELESMIKVTRAERDRSQEVATTAGDVVRRTLEMLIANRQPGGVKAADLLMNAESFSHGDIKAFRHTERDASDVVSGPLQVKPHHVLLAFVNCVLEDVEMEPTRVTQLSSGMSDGANYATLLTHIFPESKVGPRMAATSDITERFSILVNEGSALLAQRDTTPQTSAKLPSEGKKKPDAGPLVSCGLSPLDLSEGSEAAHLATVYFMMKSYFAKFTVVELEPVDENKENRFDNTEKEAVILYLCERSLASWRVLLQHVEDGIVADFYLLAKGSRAEALLADVRDDAIMRRFAVQIAAQDEDGMDIYQVVGGRPPTAEESASQSLSRLCHNLPERKRVVTELHLHVHLLHEVFQHFSSKSTTMPLEGFEQFCQECGVDETVKTAKIKQAFVDCSKFEPTHGLHPPEFVASCVAIAIEVAPHHVRGPTAKLGFFMNRYMHSRLKIMSSEPMRRIMQNPAVNAVLNVVRSGLHCFFEGSATSPKNGDVNIADATMSESTFVKLMRDLSFVDERCTAKEAALIFNNAQDAFDNSGINDMSFNEFVEALCAVGLMRIGNPYYGPAVRLSIFFNEKLLPHVRKKFPPLFNKMSVKMKVDMDSIVGSDGSETEDGSPSAV